MPAAMKEARDLAKALYLQGFKPEAIAAKTGCKKQTVQTWACRFKWNKLVNKSLELSSQSERMQAYEANVRSRLSAHLDKSTACLDRLDAPTSLRGMKEHAQAMIPVVDVATKVFGWGSQANQAGAFAVGVLSGMVSGTIRPPQDDPTSTGPVIDVPSQDVPDEDQSNLSGICQDNQSGDTDNLESG